jgi:hypothetical protein
MSQKKRYYIIDAASDFIEIDDLIKTYGPSVCVLKSNYDGQFIDVGPHLFDSSVKLDELLMNTQWGKGSFISLSFSRERMNLIHLLRNNSEIVTEQDEVMFFRYYDPRILRIFLPVFDTQQIKEFFGSVDEFMCEDEDPAFGLIFQTDKSNKLKTYRLPLDEFKKYLSSGDQSLLKEFKPNNELSSDSSKQSHQPKSKSDGKNKFSIFD